MPQTAECHRAQAPTPQASVRRGPSEGAVVELENDPLEDLCSLAEAYRKEHGLTADEAIERILTRIRSR